MSLEFEKSPQLISKIKSYQSSPLEINDFIDQDTFKKILNIKDECYLDDELCHPKLYQNGKPRGLTATPNESIKNKLDTLLKEKFSTVMDTEEDFEVEYAFHRNYFPYGIHTDSGYDSKELIYRQGIIPLEIEPSDKDVYTVVFDQKVYHSAGFTRNQEINQQNESDYVDWQSQAGAVSAQDFNVTHNCWQGEVEWLKGLSISLPFKWKVGSMAIWDRAHLHCSSDFETTGVEYKLGLMWISRIKRKQQM